MRVRNCRAALDAKPFSRVAMTFAQRVLLRYGSVTQGSGNSLTGMVTASDANDINDRCVIVVLVRKGSVADKHHFAKQFESENDSDTINTLHVCLCRHGANDPPSCVKNRAP